MSHNSSETIQNKRGKWLNVAALKPLIAEILRERRVTLRPENRFEREEYENLPQALYAAGQRSIYQGDVTPSPQQRLTDLLQMLRYRDR